jgi:ABC-type multidrug transport system permease subunit
MTREIWLTLHNEARLLLKDRVVLLMLLLAPVVIITVAGYSLRDLYGGGRDGLRVPVVDADHGAVASAVLDALRRESVITVEPARSLDEARELVRRSDRAPLALEIPADTSAAVAAGRPARLVLHVDPARRIEIDALEIQLGKLSREVAEAARARAQDAIDASHDTLERLAATLERQQAEMRDAAVRTRDAAALTTRASINRAFARAVHDVGARVEARQEAARASLEQELGARQESLGRLRQYVEALQRSQRELEVWLTGLRTKAGGRAAAIPPPPIAPAPPSEADLVVLSRPIALPAVDDSLLGAPVLARTLAIDLPEIAVPDPGGLAADLERLRAAAAPTLPSALEIVEQPTNPGTTVAVNAFDQYVPGFGVTFLMIGMMLGVALTLFDERDWGTLRRLRAGGASLTGVVLGKLVARFVVGMVQMAVLFAIGWALFGISLGRDPLALLLPTVGISFTAAALGLVVAVLARAHDSVMPLGTMTSMAMSAIGGCWWPLDFEPGVMRAIAKWLPTTWTMQAYNDLMIRRLPVGAALWPLAATIGLGVIYLVVGLLGTVWLEE